MTPPDEIRTTALTLTAGGIWRRRHGGAARSALAHRVATGAVAAISLGDLLRQIPGLQVEGLPTMVANLQLVADFPLTMAGEGPAVVRAVVVQARRAVGRWHQAVGVRQDMTSTSLDRPAVATRLCRQAARKAIDHLGDPTAVRISLLDADEMILHQEYRSCQDPRLRVIRRPDLLTQIPERGDELLDARFRDPAAEIQRLVATAIRRHVRQAARVARTVSIPPLVIAASA